MSLERASSSIQPTVEMNNTVQDNATTKLKPAPRKGQAIPKATHMGPLKLGDLVIDCAVLEPQGREVPLRVLSERGVARVFGKTGRGSPSWFRSTEGRRGPSLPLFISARNLIPYISGTLLVQLTEPIIYKGTNGAKTYGIEATLLGEICKVWITAGNAGALSQNQTHIARKAEILRDALVGVAIASLIDDATGYVDVRPRDQLHRLLEMYIAPELLPWTKRFPDSFYKELFRLREWQYDPPSPKRPKYVGKLTNELVYEKLPHGILEALKARTPKSPSGNRLHRFHQLLTEDVGDEHLGRQLASVTTLMRVSNSWSTFRRLFEKAFPANEGQLRLMPDIDGEELEE